MTSFFSKNCSKMAGRQTAKTRGFNCGDYIPLIFTSLFLLSFSIYFALQLFRDNYLLTTQSNNLSEAAAFSAIANFQNYIVCFISPLLIVLLSNHFSSLEAIVAALSLQVTFIILSIRGKSYLQLNFNNQG